MGLTPERIRSKRLELGLTQEQLAFKSGITITTIGKYERNESSPTGLYVNALKKALDIMDE